MELLITVKKSTESQLKKLKKHFPGIKNDVSDQEGFFIPPWKTVSAKSYQDAVLKLFCVLQKEYGIKFINYYKGTKGIYLKTDNPIAVNGGFIKELHVSKKNKTAVEVAAEEEKYALCVYEFLVILLTHYDSFAGSNAYVVCPGDQMTSISENQEFDHIPILKISKSEIYLISHGKNEKLTFSFATGKKH